MQLKVFLSYARKDGKDHVVKLDVQLTERGVQTWYDRRSINPAHDFSTEIEKGIEGADSVVICLTPDVKRDDSFVRREIGYAQIMDKPIYVAKFDAKAVPPITVVTNTYFTFYENWDEAFSDLCSNLQKWLPPGEVPQQLPATTGETLDTAAAPPVTPPEAAPPPAAEKDAPVATEAPVTPQISAKPLTPKPPRTKQSPRPDPVLKPVFQDTQSVSQAYHGKLYRLVLEFLEQAMITHINLSGTAAPGAVTGGGSMHRGLDSASETADGRVLQFETITNAFEHYDQRMLLLGEPGSGKTVTLMAFARNAIARRLTDPTAPLVLIGFVQTWDPEKDLSIVDWLCESHPELDPHQVRQDINDGKALLLLDGLDELGQERLRSRSDPFARGVRKASANAIENTFNELFGKRATIETDFEDNQGRTDSPENAQEVIERYDPRPLFIDRLLEVPRAQVLLTCRVRDFNDIGKQVALNGAVTLQPLSDLQLTAFLYDQPDLLTALRADQALRDMLRSPLLLNLFAYAYADRGADAGRLRVLQNSPGDLRDEILNTYVRKRYDWESALENTAIPYSLAGLYDALGQIAMRAAADGRTANLLKLADVKAVIGENALLLIDWAEQLNLLARVETETWRFIHMLVRDHFAFSYALRNLRTTAVFAGSGFAPDPKYRSFELWLNITPYSETLATRALGEIGDPRAVPHLIQVLEESTSAELRQGTAVALGRIGDERALDALIALFDDSVMSTRRAATDALRHFGERGISLAAGTLRTGSTLAREQAAIFLTDSADPRADDLLIAALKDVDAPVRARAVHALGQRQTPGTLAAIRERVTDPELYVRAVTARVLGALGDTEAVDSLIELLGEPESPRLAAAASDQGLKRGSARLQALGAIVNNAGKAVITAYAAREAIPEADNLRPLTVRVNAARSLGQLGDQRAVGPLITSLLDHMATVRKQAAASLDSLGWKPVSDEEITAYMIAQQKWSEVAKMGSLAVPALCFCLNDEEWTIRKSAAEQLGVIGDAAASPALLDTLQRYNDGQTFNTVLAALIRIRDPECVEPLFALMLNSSDKGVRRAIIDGFGEMRLPQAVDGLCSIIADPDLNTRAAIINALGSIGDRQAVPALITMLDDNSRLKAAGVVSIGPRINYLASEALKAIGTPDAAAAVESWKKNDGRKGFWPFGKR